MKNKGMSRKVSFLQGVELAFFTAVVAALVKRAEVLWALSKKFIIVTIPYHKYDILKFVPSFYKPILLQILWAIHEALIYEPRNRSANHASDQ